jgi:hypothetical protein
MQNEMEDISQLKNRFKSESIKNQLQIIPELINSGDDGLAFLMDFLRDRQSTPANVVVGAVYQAVYQTNSQATQEFLQELLPNGIIPLESENNIDYRPLQQLLVQQDFEAADSLTRQKLCELAGAAAVQRKWVYFTEVEQFPKTDLDTIDRLWSIHSQGKFGFSVQREIWLSLDRDFSKLWTKIGWKSGNNWTKYPEEFTWSLSAPKGHLPLSNQLRGVRVIASLFSHPVWSKNTEIALIK